MNNVVFVFWEKNLLTQWKTEEENQVTNQWKTSQP